MDTAYEETAADPNLALAKVIALMLQWGLRREDLEHILADAVTVQDLQPRQTLYDQDSPVTTVYLLTTGTLYQDRMSVDSQGRRRVSLRREVHAGQLAGAYDLLYSRRYSTRTRALEVCQLAAIKSAAVEKLLYAFPDLRKRIAPVARMGRLRTIPLLRDLDLTALAYVAEAAVPQHFAQDEAIYTDADAAKRIFVIDRGQVRLTWPDGAAQWLGNGMGFGIVDAPLPNPGASGGAVYGHAAYATTETDVFVWPRRALVGLTNINPEKAEMELRQARQEALAATAPFARFTSDQRRRLIGYMSHYYLPIPHLLMQQGELGESLWILMPHSQAILHALERGQALQPVRIYGPNFFSELALKVEHPLDSTVEAEAGSQWLRLHHGDFRAFLADAGPHLLSRLELGPAEERFLGHNRARRRYGWLGAGENLVIFQRRHIIALLRKASISFVLVGILGLFAVIFLRRASGEPWQIMLLATFGLLAVLQFVWAVLDYLNDYILVTNQRIVHQEKLLFFAEWRQAAFLEQVRNVDVKVTFFGNLLNYGNLRIQTAATAGSIRFDYVPNAHNIRAKILEQQSLRQQHYQASSKMIIQNLLEERLGLRLEMPVRVTAGRAERAQGPDWLRRVRSWLKLDRPSQPFLADHLVWRKHWLILLGKISGPAIILAFILLLVSLQGLLPASVGVLVAALDMGLAFIGLGTMAWLAWNVADWRNDTYEIDNKQIADVAKKPLFFAENRRTALLGEIENIEVRMPSPINFLFNFGDVRLQTAATEGLFTFDWVPNPRAVSEEIRRRIEVYRQQQETTRMRQRAEEMPDWFEIYDRLEGNGDGVQNSGNGRP